MISMWIGIVVGAFIVLALAWKFTLGGSGGSGLKGAVVREKIKMGALAIDVRTPSEYQSDHYKGAKNIPLQELQSRLSELGDKNMPIVVYCASGLRSAMALKILTKAGFTDVMNGGR